MEQWTVSNQKRSSSRLYIVTLLLNSHAEYIMQNAGLDEAQAGIKIAGRNINSLRYADDTTFMAESEELKSSLMKVKEESEKVGLKFNIQKTKIMASGPITSWEIDGETVETVADFIFGGGSKIIADGDCSHEIKRHLLLGRKAMTNLLHPWDFPGKSTGVGCHFLLQRIFLTQGLNPGLLHCRHTLYCLSHQGNHDQPRQHIQKQRHYFVTKGPSSQGYGLWYV